MTESDETLDDSSEGLAMQLGIKGHGMQTLGLWLLWLSIFATVAMFFFRTRLSVVDRLGQANCSAAELASGLATLQLQAVMTVWTACGFIAGIILYAAGGVIATAKQRSIVIM